MVSQGDRRLQPREGLRERPQPAALLGRRPDAPTAQRRRRQRSTSREPPASGRWRHLGSPNWIVATAARVGASRKLSGGAKRRPLMPLLRRS